MVENATANTTMLANLVDPEVMTANTSYSLKNGLRYLAIADLDTTLQGQPGNTVSLPAFGYIGDASEVAEGAAIPLSKLSSTLKKVEIKKIGQGTALTDESLLSGYGDPVKETAQQLGLSLANKVDNDVFGALLTSKQTVAGSFSTMDGLQAGLDIFDDEDDNPVVAFLSPTDAAKLRKDATTTWTKGSELGAARVFSGTFGDVLGAQIVRSKKIANGGGFLVKASIKGASSALKIFLKRDVIIEPTRKANTASTEWYATEHYAAYLNDPSKVVKVTGTELVTTDVKSNSADTDSIPTDANTVDEIKNWLDEHHIDYGNVTLKADLLALVN